MVEVSTRCMGVGMTTERNNPIGYLRGFTECVYKRADGAVIVVYVDDLMVFHVDRGCLDELLGQIRARFDATPPWYLADATRDAPLDFLGHNIWLEGGAIVIGMARFLEGIHSNGPTAAMSTGRGLRFGAVHAKLDLALSDDLVQTWLAHTGSHKAGVLFSEWAMCQHAISGTLSSHVVPRPTSATALPYVYLDSTFYGETNPRGPGCRNC